MPMQVIKENGKIRILFADPVQRLERTLDEILASVDRARQVSLEATPNLKLLLLYLRSVETHNRSYSHHEPCRVRADIYKDIAERVEFILAGESPCQQTKTTPSST